MKKLIIAVLLIALSASLFASPALIVRPHIGLTLGSEDALRGAGAGVHVMYNTLGTGIHLGVWTNANYDIWYSNMSMPVALTLGKDFYILAGTTFDLTTATNPLTETTTSPAGFFNTFGLGINLDLLPLGEKMTLGANGELLYTNYAAESTGDNLADGLGMFVGLIANIKAFASINLSFLF